MSHKLDIIQSGYFIYRKCPYCKHKVITIAHVSKPQCPHCNKEFKLDRTQDWLFSVLRDKDNQIYNLLLNIPDYPRPPSKKNAYGVMYQPKLQRCLLYLKRNVKQFETKLASLIDKTRPPNTPWDTECVLQVTFNPQDLRGDTLNIGGVIGDALERGNLIKRDALITKLKIIRLKKNTELALGIAVAWRDYEEFSII